MRITVENGIGVNGAVMFNNIKSINTNSSNQEILTIPTQYKPFVIDKATNTGVNSIPSINQMNLNESNSNVNQIINIIPNKIEYNVDFYLNYNQTPPSLGAGSDFVYFDDKIKSNLEIEIPLSLIASNLVLSDTIDLNINNVNNIESGTFYLLINNGFPLEADIQLYILDDNSNIIDSLFTENTMIYAADIDLANNRVNKKTKSRLPIIMSESKFNLFIKTKRILIKSKFKTQPQSNHVQIYSDYTVEFKLTGDFTYHIGM